MCDYNATGVENPDCRVSTTTRQVCQDEVVLTITFNSKNLDSALSFEPGTYYLISYSPGNKTLDGYLPNSEGGECLDGYKMAMNVQLLAVLTTIPPQIATTTDNEDLFTKESLKTSDSQPRTQLLSLSAIIGMGVAFSVLVILLIVLVTIASIATLYQCKQTRTLPDESGTHINNRKTEASAFNITEHEPEVGENVTYGTVSQEEVPLKEKVVYDTPHNHVLMSDNAAYGVGKNEIPMNENTAYGINTNDGPENDDVDYW